MKVLEYKPPRTVIGGAIVFMVFAVVFFVFTFPLAEMAGADFQLMFLTFMGLFFAVPVILLLRAKRTRRKISLFMEDASIGETMTLPQPVRYEVGTYTCTGEWRGGGKNRHYYTSHTFRKTESGEGPAITLPEGPFIVTVKRDDSGLLEFPAVRILSEPYKNVLLLLMSSDGTVNASGTVEAATENDSAQLSIRGAGRSLTGTVYATLQKARKAKVEIFHTAWERNRFKIGEGITFDFSQELLPGEDTLIVAYEGFSPRDFRMLMRGGEYIMGHGTYGIRLVLDIPLHPDVSSEGSFEVSLKEEPEQEKGEKGGETWPRIRRPSSGDQISGTPSDHREQHHTFSPYPPLPNRTPPIRKKR